MSDFIVIFFQILTLILGIYILSNKTLNSKLLFFMLFMGVMFGYPLYNSMGALGIFFVSCLFMIILVIKTKEFTSNIILLISSLIIFILGGYIAPLINRHFFSEPLEILATNHLFLISTVFLGSFISLVIYLLINYMINRLKIKNLFNKKYSRVIIFFGIITVTIFYLLIYKEGLLGISLEMSRINSIIFFLYAILSLMVYVILFRLEYKNIQIENEKIQSEQLQLYTEEIELHYEEVRKIRHDYINILLTMTEYLVQKDLDGLTKFFNEKIIPIEKQLKDDSHQLAKLAQLKIPAIKGIISNKVIKAQGMDIKIKVEVPETIEKINMDTMNLCRSLGIILDNAIEATRLSTAPKIEILFLNLKSSNFIIIKNSYKDRGISIEQLYEKGFSTKGKDRGRGLSILREMVRENESVYLSTHMKDGYFIQELEIKKGK